MEVQQSNVIDEIIRKSAVRDRIIHIFGVVEDTMALEVQHYINRIIRKDSEERKTDDEKKITLLINSYGGSVWSGNIIIGAINHAQSLGYEVTGICQGFAFSMAFDILLACDKRHGYTFSEYMMHQTQCGHQYGALVQGERSLQYSKKQWEKSVDMYVAKTKITRESIEEMYEKDRDWFMLTEEALELGVIHEII